MKKYLLIITLLPCLLFAQSYDTGVSVTPQTAFATRYWIDNNPSYSITRVLNGRFQLDVASLPEGIHTLHCQVAGSDMSLSYVRSVMFYKPHIHSESADGATLRYWFDDNPNVYITTTGISLINIPDLGIGEHILHLQIAHSDGSLGYIRSEHFEQSVEKFENADNWDMQHPDNPGYYKLTLDVNSDAMGSVAGAGMYAQNMPVRISAVPNEGYKFVRWSDGSTIADRTVFLTQDTSFTAFFEIAWYTVTFVNYDGMVLQEGNAVYGSVPEYTGETPVRPSTPSYSYTFTGWEPEVGAVSGNTVYTAVFEEKTLPTGIVNAGEKAANNYPRKVVIDNHLYILMPDGGLYTVTGSKLK